LAIDIYGITYGIKNANGILPGGSHMVNVSKDLNPELTLLGTPCILEGVGSGVKLPNELVLAGTVKEVATCWRSSGNKLQATSLTRHPR